MPGSCCALPDVKSEQDVFVGAIRPPPCQILLASALSPGRPSLVVRVSVEPFTVTVVVARMTVVPATDDVIWTVQEPVAAIVVQVLTPPTKLPGPETIEKVMRVPAGALV